MGIDSKLAKYEPQYASEIEPYPSAQRADELFVRVGADERKVDDMQLVDLYSKVSTAYTAQKQEYYESLENVADEYRKKYEDLSNGYSALRVLVIILLVVNTVALVALAFASKNHLQNNNKISANKNKSEKTTREDSENNGRYYECAACGASVNSDEACCPECGTKKQDDILPTIIILGFLLIVIIYFVTSKT